MIGKLVNRSIQLGKARFEVTAQALRRAAQQGLGADGAGRRQDRSDFETMNQLDSLPDLEARRRSSPGRSAAHISAKPFLTQHKAASKHSPSDPL
jgi:hypothetical protein